MFATLFLLGGIIIASFGYHLFNNITILLGASFVSTILFLITIFIDRTLSVVFAIIGFILGFFIFFQFKKIPKLRKVLTFFVGIVLVIMIAVLFVNKMPEYLQYIINSITFITTITIIIKKEKLFIITVTSFLGSHFISIFVFFIISEFTIIDSTFSFSDFLDSLTNLKIVILSIILSVIFIIFQYKFSITVLKKIRNIKSRKIK
jgi:hypothetical protein